MITRDTANVTITIYNHVLLGESFTFKRTVIEDCKWGILEESKNTAQGLKVPEIVKLIIPWDFNYFSTQNGEVFDSSEDNWTVRMGSEEIGSYIVRGEHLYEFPENLTRSEMISQHVRLFEEMVKFRKPSRIVEHFIGSRNMWYIEVMC